MGLLQRLHGGPESPGKKGEAPENQGGSQTPTPGPRKEEGTVFNFHSQIPGRMSGLLLGHPGLGQKRGLPFGW